MSIRPSATVLLNNLVYEKRAKGEKVYNFAVGDIILPNHPMIIKSASAALKRGVFPYPPSGGLPELRKAAANWMNQKYKTNFSSENTLVTPGGKFALYAALKTLLKPDDEVLISAPYWVSYPSIIQFCGGKPVCIPTKWKITPAELEKKRTHRTKIFIFNNPCNPTGVVYTKEEVEALAQFAKNHNLIVISDEVYSEIIYDKKPFFSFGSHDNVILIQSCSKNFGMSGWRVGFAFGKESILKEMISLMMQTVSSTSSISQWGAVGAIENADEVSGYITRAMDKKRKLFFETLAKNIKLPDSAIFAFLPILEKNTTAFCEKVLKETNVAIVPGMEFGMEGYVRFSFSETDEDIVEGLQQLKKHGYL